MLEELIPYHPIISKILEYRKYKKLSSTYVEGLKDTIGPDSRIRSVFRQTDTRTGRISSAEPNMQNIPNRKNQQYRTKSSEYSGADGAWPSDPESLRAKAWLCLSGCRLFPD